jgi:hypothetical protein
MKTKPPPGRRTFADARDEMEYLYHKLLYWLYDREEPTRARVYAKRLARLLSKVCPGHHAIFPEECWSLICEARHDLSGAIAHRENEIRLLKRLHEISRNTAREEDILRWYGHDDLSDRMDLLATLYHDVGELDKAITTLYESKQVCETHGIKFDGEALLRDCQREKRSLDGEYRPRGRQYP